MGTFHHGQYREGVGDPTKVTQNRAINPAGKYQPTLQEVVLKFPIPISISRIFSLSEQKQWSYTLKCMEKGKGNERKKEHSDPNLPLNVKIKAKKGI